MSNQTELLKGSRQKNTSQFKNFIESNKVYLQEKFYEHFHISKEKSNEKINLTSLPIEKLLSYIFQIFSLERYSKDSKTYNIIKKSVQQNVKQFLIEFNPNKLSKANQLTFDILKEILIFIVERNAIFSIQYETKLVDQQNQLSNQNNKKQLNFQIDINLDQDRQNNNIISDYQTECKINDSSPKMKKKGMNSFSLQNQFETPSNLDNVNQQILLQKLIKKNAKALFDFYCRQQMQLGGVITFDRLNEETSSMSLGKCLTFAKATNLYNKIIKREHLVIKFKKLTQGKKYINFQKFQVMIGQFQVMDSSFNQRIGLLSQDIRKILKYVKLPFNTKDVRPRQNIAIRNFSSRLTDHSGQTSEELKLQLSQKKQQMINAKRLVQIKEYMQWKQSQPQMIKQNDLKSSRLPKRKDLAVDLSFIGSIIHPEEDDQTYLKDHLIPKLEKQTEKVQRFGNVFESQRYKSLDKLTLRKQSVVSDIRKRIKQIESSQNLSMSLKMKQSLIRSSSPHKRYTHN